jgi:N-acetylmuramoyl-L-alanine amidase
VLRPIEGRRNPSLNRRGGLSLLFAMLGSALALPGVSHADVDLFDVVILDAGHGGEDTGARGAGGLIEKQVVLDVAKRLAHRLREAGLTVVLTRPDDSFVPLEVRTSVANDARGDLFISIHANSARSAKPRGIESYFVSLEASDALSGELAARENESFGSAAPASFKLDPLSAILGDMAVNEHVRESSEFAKQAQLELAAIDGSPSRGVKQAPFVVLMGVRMPATLLEIGFLSNGDEERALGTTARRDAIAAAIARAVVTFGVEYDQRHGAQHATRPAAPAAGHARGAADRTGP